MGPLARRSPLTVRPLRSASTSPQLGCEEDLHLQAVEHARHTQKKRPSFHWDVFAYVGGVAADYWPGLSNCVKPVVFTSRNSGVRGGNNEGFRKLLSNE
jgi:hypothetical protein